MPQVTVVALSLHEAADALRAYAAKKLKVKAKDILVVQVCSYNKPRLQIEYDEGNYAWDQLVTARHRTYNGEV